MSFSLLPFFFCKDIINIYTRYTISALLVSSNTSSSTPRSFSSSAPGLLRVQYFTYVLEVANKLPNGLHANLKMGFALSLNLWWAASIIAPSLIAYIILCEATSVPSHSFTIQYTTRPSIPVLTNKSSNCGCQAMLSTLSEWALNRYCYVCTLRISHSRTVASREALSNICPSGCQRTQFTVLLCPCNEATLPRNIDVRGSHNRICVSWLPVAIMDRNGCQWMVVTSPPCPYNLAYSRAS